LRKKRKSARKNAKRRVVPENQPALSQKKRKPYIIGLSAKVLKAKRKVGLIVTHPTVKAAISLVADLLVKNAKNILHVVLLPVRVKKEAKAKAGAKKQNVKVKENELND
jgi:hypothetical protein